MYIKTLLTASFLLLIANVFSQTKDSVDTKVFEQVESEAAYPGGNTAWAKYLQKALDNFNPAENGAPVGRYQVIARFIVSKSGATSDVIAETKLGYGMEAKVITAIKNSGNWEPAIQFGRPVNAYRRQPVTFIVDSEDFEIVTETPYTLYTNTKNQITVKARNVKPENVGINVTGGKVTSNNYDGTFIIFVTKPGRVTIEVVNTNKNDKVVGTASIEAVEKK